VWDCCMINMNWHVQGTNMALEDAVELARAIGK
jgi:hypothetical protein